MQAAHRTTRQHAQDVVPLYVAYLGGLLLLALLVLLLRLRLLDGGGPCGSADLGGLVSSCCDGREVGANDATLVLYGAAGALLCDLLRDALLVHAAVHLRPGDLARVLALQEERLILARREAEDLCSWVGCPQSWQQTGVQTCLVVASDEEAPLAGVDTVAGERVDLNLLHSIAYRQRTHNSDRHPAVRTIYATRNAKSKRDQHFTLGRHQARMRHQPPPPAIHPHPQLFGPRLTAPLQYDLLEVSRTLFEHSFDTHLADLPGMLSGTVRATLSLPV